MSNESTNGIFTYDQQVRRAALIQAVAIMDGDTSDLLPILRLAEYISVGRDIIDSGTPEDGPRVMNFHSDNSPTLLDLIKRQTEQQQEPPC